MQQNGITMGLATNTAQQRKFLIRFRVALNDAAKSAGFPNINTPTSGSELEQALVEFFTDPQFDQNKEHYRTMATLLAREVLFPDQNPNKTRSSAHIAQISRLANSLLTHIDRGTMIVDYRAAYESDVQAANNHDPEKDTSSGWVADFHAGKTGSSKRFR